MNKNKLYFFSDFHLGMPQGEISINREKKVVDVLNSISNDAHSIFLLGDIFDFWFEYKEVVPKGFFRLLNVLSELRSKGTNVYLFPGNHDLWYGNYLVEYCGVKILREPTEFYFRSFKFHVHHGDGLGPGDTKYKILKYIFLHPISIYIFKWLHPDIGVRFARYLSSKSRLSQGITKDKYLGDNKEFLTQYCLDILKNQTPKDEVFSDKQTVEIVSNDKAIVDYFVFGHRHLLLDISLSEKSRYINLGHWLGNGNYGVFDGDNFILIPVS